ncbi:hypothetical protein N566_09310 [Streptomycetaceae bacterium MP113-05]|nr:hypothetical protein N566_09310 [Streptomycetaceae bacterium MP113-05]
MLTIEERDGTRMAEVDFGGVVKEVCLEYVPDLRVGEYTIVHVGFALQRLDEESARQTLELFAGLGLIEEEFGDAWLQASRESGEPVPAGLPAAAGDPTPDGGPASVAGRAEEEAR